ncbi:hypothetical protein V0242_24660 (plasmid) [Aeromonas hydrophila]|uniref:hypothetical protein n=1 Tax=Aeromonas hydrophila TaxID=644 RepID=UPI002ED13F1C|nr:hypothetical protein V0242_24660 [Aeromonas hydrophila]
MRNKSLLAIMIAGLSIQSAYAIDTTAAAAIAETNLATRADAEKQVASIVNGMQGIKTALQRYYVDKRGWPTSLAALENSGYLKQGLSARLGVVSGLMSGGSYGLRLTLPSGGAMQAKLAASRMNASLSGNVLTLTVAPPVGLLNEDDYISRTAPKAMAADITFVGTGLKNANMDANVIDVANVNIGTDVSVVRDTNVTRNIGIAGLLNGVTAILGGDATANKVVAKSSLLVAKAAVLNGAAYTNNTLQSVGNATFQGGVTANQAATFNTANFKSALTAEGTVSLNQAVTSQGVIANGPIKALGGIAGNDMTFASADVATGVDAGSLLVQGDAEVKGSFKAGDLVANRVQAVNGTFTGGLNITGLTATQAVRSNSGYYVGAGNILVADKDGGLYERGIALDTLYLGIADKAADTDKLDGLDSTQFGRRDLANTFTKQAQFNGRMDINNGLYAGGNQVLNATGTTFYEGGVALASKYLAISGKAADTALLDGLDSSLFGRRDAANTWTGGNQFNAGINVLSGLKAGGTLVADGSQLYEGGIGLASKYLGKTATAANTQLLDGIDSSALAKVGSNNVFTGANTFSQNIAVKGTGLMTAVNNSTSAVTNLEANTSAAESRVNNLLYFKSRCHVHNMDPGCNIYMKPPAPALGRWGGKVYVEGHSTKSAGTNPRCSRSYSVNNYSPESTICDGAGGRSGYYCQPNLPSSCRIGDMYYAYERDCVTGSGAGDHSDPKITYFRWYKYICG